MADSVEQDIGGIYAQNIFVLEKELGGSAATNEESLLLKFHNQLEHYQKMVKEEEKQMKSSQKGRGTFG